MLVENIMGVCFKVCFATIDQYLLKVVGPVGVSQTIYRISVRLLRSTQTGFIFPYSIFIFCFIFLVLIHFVLDYFYLYGYLMAMIPTSTVDVLLILVSNFYDL